MIRRHAAPAVLLALTMLLFCVAGAAARTVWLCRPGQAHDPCTPGLATTLYSPTLASRGVIRPGVVAHPRVDCFYVYPTISDQKGPYANLRIDPEERSIALYQAARYSQVCRVFAPMYRQVTVPALEGGYPENPPQLAKPLADVRAAFANYLRQYNHGRPFVLLGHSQGSFLLRELVQRDIDNHPALRRRMLSAILLGGNLLVKAGRAVGGDFHHVPLCRAASSIGCLIAYSTFDQPPPANSLFGRTPVHGDRVACVNPAALLGRSTLTPIFPSAPFAPGTLIAAGISLLKLTQPHPATVWSQEDGAYSARCSSANGANVLQLTALHGAQVATPSPDPTWGLHLIDANIELGDLVTIVGREARAYG